jgi:hypothetical protein
VTDDPVGSLRAQLRRDLQAAMKDRRRDETTALRGLLAAIDNAEAVGDPLSPTPPAQASSAHIAGAVAGIGAAEVERRRLSAAELERLMEAELSDRRSQADRFDALGRADDAARLRSEAQVIARYGVAGR